ncbi:chemotaxis protein CheA [Geomonas sp.]|uniref:chemotaxis protein CheA n=1 Tax=Geomonas sp. TaxID=2651584 RepID=UPI002B45F864|nr:chemotaxis protein CheA [Geomonas sp.]HJV35061.1 chemotaxis protein CheA [Geomonas sp.]
MSQYKNLFLSESREYLKSIGQTVVALEQAPGDRAAIDALFRAAHSMKGMAASMDYREVVTVAHAMEDLMIRVRDQGLRFDAGVADLLLEGADLIEGLLSDVEADLDPRRPVGDYPQRLSGYAPAAPEAASAPSGAQPAGSGAGEPGSPAATTDPAEVERPQGTAAPAEDAQATEGRGVAAAGEKEPAGELITVRVRTELLDHLINLTGELITNKHRLLNIGKELDSPRLHEAVSDTGKLLRSLHDEVMKVRLMPFEMIADRFQRSVRTLAKRSGKELHFELEGREIGLDRGILEQLIDPLNHLLRNAVDHGLEPSQERLSAGKPARGLVKLSVARDRDRVLITVSDDGRGMEPSRIIQAALEKGFISQEESERLSPRQALMLSCIPGFSTAKEVTDVSGRGVGMDAVNASIQKLGGTLAIDSEPGVGSRFTLRLPMTIAIIHALIVQCGPIKMGVPVTVVHRTVELRREQVETVGKRQVFHLDDEPIQLLSLNRVLGLPLGRFPSGIVPLFVTEAKGRRVGLVVDRLLGQHELFVKPLGRPLSRLHGLAGGAILGDGEVVTILDIADLL